MASFKAVVLKWNKRSDGTYIINIRVTHNRKSKYINTGFVITKDDITKSFKLKNHFFIDETEKVIKKYRDICNKNVSLIREFDVSQVFDLVTKIEKSDMIFIDIVKYGRDYIDMLLKNKKIGTAKNLKNAINNLIKFVGREQIDINEITAKFIKDWINWIEGDRAKSLYPAGIRKLHNEAKKEFNIEELGIIKIPLSPFSVVKLPKIQKSKIPHIPIEKIRELFKLEDITIYQRGNNRQNFARDVFLISFCLWGVNAKDLYECTEYKNVRITYNRAKTKDRRDDRALISAKVEPEIEHLIEKYRDKTGKRVFCFYQMYKNEDSFNNAIGKGIKQLRNAIDIDYLIFYSARHYFATIARNKAKIEKYTVHQMLNHTDNEIK